MIACVDIILCGILLAFVRTREVGVSSRNVVSRTFPHFSQSMLTPMRMKMSNPSKRERDSNTGSLDCDSGLLPLSYRNNKSNNNISINTNNIVNTITLQ